MKKKSNLLTNISILNLIIKNFSTNTIEPKQSKFDCIINNLLFYAPQF